MSFYSFNHNQKKSPGKSISNQLSQERVDNGTTRIADNRPEAIFQRRMMAVMNNNHQVSQLASLKALVRKNETTTLQYKEKTDQESLADTKVNNTGLPDNLKTGIEQLSGIDISDVKVHYNSDKPSQLQAHAYAQGTDIHVAPGQERHLPHEAWHVVQQKQGRVKPTLQMKTGVYVNDDTGLEHEADVMGAKALQMKCDQCEREEAAQRKVTSSVVQRMPPKKGGASKSSTKPKESKTESKDSGGGKLNIDHHGCYRDDECKRRAGDAKFCHNCTGQGGSYVRWSGSIGDSQTITFCFPCAELGKDESTQKEKITTAFRENLEVTASA